MGGTADEMLRRLARAILAAALLLAFAVSSATLLSRPSGSVAFARLPPRAPVRLAADRITVVAPTSWRGVPAGGVTGTTALPASADPIGATERGVVAAQPFSSGPATAIDRGRALQCLAAAIYYEAATEPPAGRQAVAQVVLNRVRHPAFSRTVCGVVYQGSERAGCQFSFACDGALARPPSIAGWSDAVRVAALALAGRVYRPVGLATHYHTFAVTPDWNRSLVMTDMVGTHFFHRWKGVWGTASAFSQRYAGGEPVPYPHAAPVRASATNGRTAAAEAITKPATIPPATRLLDFHPEVLLGSANVNSPPRPAEDEPDSQILPQWRNSGKPLRP